MEKLRELRESAGITQEELAKRSGVSRVTISKLESGAQKVTTNTTILQIAKALAIDPGLLI